MAQNFVFSMIKESLRSTQVQMDDFSNFFVKEKSAMEGCFTCSNSNSLAAGNNNFTDMFSKQKSKFFDVDKVLREIEQREIR